MSLIFPDHTTYISLLEPELFGGWRFSIGSTLLLVATARILHAMFVSVPRSEAGGMFGKGARGNEATRLIETLTFVTSVGHATSGLSWRLGLGRRLSGL